LFDVFKEAKIIPAYPILINIESILAANN